MRVEDVDEIIEEHVLGGRPVERLVIPPERLTGIARELPGAGGAGSTSD